MMLPEELRDALNIFVKYQSQEIYFNQDAFVVDSVRIDKVNELDRRDLLNLGWTYAGDGYWQRKTN